MERLEPGKGYEGAKRERGFFDVETNGNGIFRDLPNRITVWHSHCDEVKELDVKCTASLCKIQAMQHEIDCFEFSFILNFLMKNSPPARA